MIAGKRALRAAVIGAGRASQSLHMPVLARLRDAEALTLVAVCDLDEARAARARRSFGFLEHGGDAIAVTERDDIDAVYVLGSAQMHYEYGLRALHGGKHLFVEKPAAPGYAQACILADAARRRGLVAVGGHNRRFYASVAALRARCGKAGWNYVTATFHKSETGKRPPFGATSWLSANGIHALDVLVFMMGGLPQHVAATAGDGVYSAVMRWKNGAQGVFLCNNKAGARCEEYAFHAPGETCRVGEGAFVIQNRHSTSREPPVPVGDGIAAEHEAFLEAIRTGNAPVHALKALLPSLYLAERIEEGFEGDLVLPVVESAVRPAPVAGTILVSGADSMQADLFRLAPDHRLMSLQDLSVSSAPRPDVRAAILGRGAPSLPADVLDKLPNLSVVGVMGLSVARHGPEELSRRGVAIINASAAYAETLAEFAFALAVLGRRRAFASHELMRRGGWGTAVGPRGLGGALYRIAKRLHPAVHTLGIEPAARSVWTKVGPAVSPAAAPRDLAGATAGLVGWGASARAFCQRLQRAGVRVLVYSEHAQEDELPEAAPLADVLAADIVSLHRGLTPETRHCLGAAELAYLRPGAVLINVARGALIEPGALLSRLARGDIFACLDAYEAEPLPPHHPLRRLPNVFLTSHIGGGSPEMHEAAADEVVTKVAAWLKGDGAVALTPARLRTMT